MRRTLESIQWGLFCTSSWTWCIGMYLPFVMMRLWGWPGFWAFFVPNVLGCAAFGFVLDAGRSRALAARLGWTCALFSAVTVAFQCYFAGWVAQWATGGADAIISPADGPALQTVVATGAPIALLVAGIALAVRGDAFWRTAGTVVTILTGLVVLLPGGVDPAAQAGRAPVTGELPAMPLLFALPTIVAGFLCSPYFDLTFHRAAQQAPSPRIAFATFGLTFGAMLLLIASFYDPGTSIPRLGTALFVLWGVQLLFTVAVHLRELLAAAPAVRIPAHVVGGLTALAVLLATPAVIAAFPNFPVQGPKGWALDEDLSFLFPGEPVYLAFLGAYGLLFPVLLLMESRGGSRRATVAVLAAGVPCYLLGAVNFMTFLMPVPLVLASLLGRRRN